MPRSHETAIHTRRTFVRVEPRASDTTSCSRRVSEACASSRDGFPRAVSLRLRLERANTVDGSGHLDGQLAERRHHAMTANMVIRGLRLRLAFVSDLQP